MLQVSYNRINWRIRVDYIFSYHIISRKNDLSDNGFPTNDLEYSSQTIREMCDYLRDKSKSAAAIDKLDFLESVVPSLDELTEMVADIKNFYLEYFELNSNDETTIIKICFNLHHASRGREHGDGCIDRIRLHLKNMVKSTGIDDPVFFKYYFRYVLAHEMFHAFQCNHYLHLSPVKANSHSELFNKILMEVLAEYFAYTYIRMFLKEKCNSDDSLYMERILNTSDSNLYSNLHYFKPDRKETLLKQSIEEINESVPEIQDYTGGYLMVLWNRKDKTGVIGRKWSWYKEIYELMASDDTSEQGLDLAYSMYNKYFS